MLAHRDLNLSATTDAKAAYEGADFVIIATPTNYDPKGNQFDTSSVEAVIAQMTEVIVYEPVLEEDHFFHSGVIRDLGAFKAEADLIVANRLSDELADVSDKIFTRDLFGADWGQPRQAGRGTTLLKHSRHLRRGASLHRLSLRWRTG